MSRIMATIKRLGEYQPGAMWNEISDPSPFDQAPRLRQEDMRRSKAQRDRHRETSRKYMQKKREMLRQLKAGKMLESATH